MPFFCLPSKKGGELVKDIKKLNKRHEKFCQEYLKDFNATRAYKTVYDSKSDNAASANASKLLRNTKVQEYLSASMQETKIKDILDINDVLENLSRLAGGIPSEKVFKRVDYTKDPPEVQFDSVTTATPEDQDQLRALELLGKYYKIFTDKVETTNDITINVGGNDSED